MEMRRSTSVAINKYEQALCSHWHWVSIVCDMWMILPADCALLLVVEVMDWQLDH